MVHCYAYGDSLLFQAVNQLCSHFEAYRDIPKITELREKFKNIKQILKSHVFSDFSRYVFFKFDVMISPQCSDRYTVKMFCGTSCASFLFFHG